MWPLFAVSVLISLVFNEATGTSGGSFGVGGVGAVVLGSLLAHSFRKDIRLTFGSAFVMALWPTCMFLLVAGFLFSWGSVAEQLEHQGSANPRRAAAYGVLIQTLITTPALAAVWAFLIVRKAKKVLGVLGASTHVDAQAPAAAETSEAG